jgi:hypothetical protein
VAFISKRTYFLSLILHTTYNFFLGNLEFQTIGYDQGSFVAILVTLQMQKHKTFSYA